MKHELNGDYFYEKDMCVVQDGIALTWNDTPSMVGDFGVLKTTCKKYSKGKCIDCGVGSMGYGACCVNASPKKFADIPDTTLIPTCVATETSIDNSKINDNCVEISNGLCIKC